MNAFNNKDAARLAQMYTEDAVLSAPASTDSGRAAIEASFKKSFDVGTFTKINSITVDKSYRVGDLNYALGAWTADMKGPEGKDVPVSGHWLSVSQYRDGRYLMSVHNVNMAMPLPR